MGDGHHGHPDEAGVLYLVAIIDGYSRRVLSWRLSNTLDWSFCVDALEEALANFPQPEIFNTDQGAQFTADAFTKVLRDRNIAISMDGKGRCLDKATIDATVRAPLRFETMRMLSCAVAIGTVVFVGCASDKAPPDAPAGQELSDAVARHPSARVQAANDMLAGALSAEELQHIQQIDWNQATPDSLLADTVFLKAVEAVLPLFDAPTSGTPAPLSELSHGGGSVHPTTGDVCTPNCDECRRYLENAIELLQTAIKDTADQGRRCGLNPFCTAAAIVRCAQLTVYLTYAAGCLLVATLTPKQSQNVIGMMKSCGPLKCAQPGQPGAEWIACFNACNTKHQCCDIKANPPKCNGGSLRVSCKGGCTAPAGAPSVHCYGGQCQDKCLGSCTAAMDSFGHCSGLCTGPCTGKCAGTAGNAVECDGVCNADFVPLCCDGGGQMVWGCAADAACASACVPKAQCH